jgi:putative membrane protein
MQFYLIGGLIFAFLVAIFALWNATEIVVRFPLLGHFTTSLALVIIGSAILGALSVMIFGIIRHVKMNLQIKRQARTINEYEQTIENLKKQIEESQSVEKSESAEIDANSLQ